MLVAGGLYEQPLEWYRIQYAGYVNGLMKRTSVVGYSSFDDDSLTVSDKETLDAIDKAKLEVPRA